MFIKASAWLTSFVRTGNDSTTPGQYMVLSGMVAPAALFCHPPAAPVAHLLTPTKVMVSCSKGILNDTLETVDEILTRIVPPAFACRLAYLSGPSFAAEVAKGLPTLVTIACKVSEKVVVAPGPKLLTRYPKHLPEWLDCLYVQLDRSQHHTNGRLMTPLQYLHFSGSVRSLGAETGFSSM
jgi:hypothetical protein